MNRAVTIQNLQKSYAKKRILSDVNLAIAEGEIFGLIGPSGAGKSTLIKIFVGMETPDEGEVRVFDKKFLTGRSSRISVIWPNPMHSVPI